MIDESDSHIFDFNHLDGPRSGTVVMLGCCHENTSKTVNDTEHLWTYNLKSSGTAVGRYYGEGKFSIEDPKPLTLRENAAALPDSYYIINSPAVAKLLVALGGVISPQMN